MTKKEETTKVLIMTFLSSANKKVNIMVPVVDPNLDAEHLKGYMTEIVEANAYYNEKDGTTLTRPLGAKIVTRTVSDLMAETVEV